MNKTLLILLSIILFSKSNIIAQEDNPVEHERLSETKKNRKNAISFYPLSLFNVDEPSFQVGYERWLNDKLTLKIMGGIIPKYGISNLFLDLASLDDYSFSGYKFSSEIKHIFFTSKSKRNNFYLSPDIFFTHVNSIESSSYYFFGIKSEKYIETNKDIYGANIKIGKQYLYKRFLLEFYGGVGLGKYYEDYYKKKLEYDISSNPYYVITEKSSEYYKINFPVNVLVGFRF